MKPPAPNPRDKAVARAQTFRDDWLECRDEPHLAPQSAWSLLAAWGAVARLFAELPAEVSDLPGFVQGDAVAVLAALHQAPEPAEWTTQVQGLSQAWDSAVSEEALRELEVAAITFFDRLDCHSLALCMARRLPVEGGQPDWLSSRSEQLAQAEAFFTAHVDAFLPAAPLASAVLAACRPNLDEADPELWLTTLRHHWLEEAWEEFETEAVVPPLSEGDKQAIQTSVEQARLKVMLPLVVAVWLGQRLQAYSRRLMPGLLLARGAPAETGLLEKRPLVWHSPDGAFEARLLLPADTLAAGSTPVRLNCYLTAEGKPALALVGKTVCLAGIERQLDERARIDFALQELHEADQDLFLQIDREPWAPEPNP